MKKVFFALVYAVLTAVLFSSCAIQQVEVDR